MVSDNNKKISAIIYNYLNLPNNITVTNKGSIAYTKVLSEDVNVVVEYISKGVSNNNALAEIF